MLSPPYVAEPAEPPPPVSVLLADSVRLLTLEATLLTALDAEDVILLSALFDALLSLLLTADDADERTDEATDETLLKAEDAPEPDAVEAKLSALVMISEALDRIEDTAEGWLVRN